MISTSSAAPVTPIISPRSPARSASTSRTACSTPPPATARCCVSAPKVRYRADLRPMSVRRSKAAPIIRSAIPSLWRAGSSSARSPAQTAPISRRRGVSTAAVADQCAASAIRSWAPRTRITTPLAGAAWPKLHLKCATGSATTALCRSSI